MSIQKLIDERKSLNEFFEQSKLKAKVVVENQNMLSTKKVSEFIRLLNYDSDIVHHVFQQTQLGKEYFVDQFCIAHYNNYFSLDLKLNIVYPIV